LEHEPHSRQGYHAGKGRAVNAAPNGLPLPAECENPDSIRKTGRQEKSHQICAAGYCADAKVGERGTAIPGAIFRARAIASK
jgi:hypothetical protein